MAKKLSDIISQNMQAGQKAQATDEGAAARRLLGAKTGKAGATAPAAGPVRSAMAERGAQVETQTGLDKLREQGVVRAQQLRGTEAEMEQKERQQRESAGMAREEMRSKFSEQEAQLFEDLESNKKQLDTKKGKAKIEELGFNMAMQDDQYLYELQDEGRRQRLDDEIGFKEALQKSIYDELYVLAEEDVEFKKLLNADDREFQEEIANINIDAALKIAEKAADAANIQAMAQGVGGVTSGVTSYYANKEKAKKVEGES